MIRGFFSKKNSERGQSFVELAISLIFLLVLLAAMIDLGWAFYTLIAMRDAAQEAAVFASMCPVDPVDGVSLNQDGIRYRLTSTTNAPIDIQDIAEEDILICVIDPSSPPETCEGEPIIDPALGYAIRIEVTIQHEIHVPFAATFIGRTTYPLKVDVTDTIMRLNEPDEENCID